MTIPENDPSTLEHDVELAVEVVGETLAVADDEQRNQIVDSLKDSLREAGVYIVDAGQPTDSDAERKGVNSGLTREQFLDNIAFKSLERSLRRARTLNKIVRRAV